ncbi:MAG TPA: hypothetical protein VLH16_01675 [Bacteroidales bacterium]|nr:hypothetical protein [Bacteroidales bacterium]
MFKLTSLQNAPRVPFRFDGRKLHSSNQIEVIHVHLKPGETTPTFTADCDVFVWVGNGEAMIETNTMKAHVEAGTFIEVKRDVDRSIANFGAVPLELLIIKVFDSTHKPIVNNL